MLLLSLFSAWNARFSTISDRLNLYRNCFISQQKEIELLKKINRYLRRRIRSIVEAHEDFVFALLQ